MKQLGTAITPAEQDEFFTKVWPEEKPAPPPAATTDSAQPPPATTTDAAVKCFIHNSIERHCFVFRPPMIHRRCAIDVERKVRTERIDRAIEKGKEPFLV